MPLPRRKRLTLTPWKVAVAGALLSVLFAIPYSVMTNVHTVYLPGGFSLNTLYLVLFLPSVSIVWALIGVGRRKREGNVLWCVFSLFLSCMSVAFAVASTISS